MIPTYRIKDWARHFENNRSRELKKTDWVPIPNHMDGAKYTEYVDHEQGAALHGAWVAIVQIASRREARGTLPESADLPRTLARISHLPAAAFALALPRLLKIGWLEEVTAAAEKIPQEGAGMSQEGAGSPHLGAEGSGNPSQADAALRARASIPFPDVLSVSVDSARANLEDTPTPTATPTATATAIDYFDSFISAANACGLSGSSKDWDDAREIWAEMVFADRLLAVKGLAMRHQAGEFDEARYRPLPSNYLKNRIWERAIRPRAAPVKTKSEKAMDILEERLAMRVNGGFR